MPFVLWFAQWNVRRLVVHSRTVHGSYYANAGAVLSRCIPGLNPVWKGSTNRFHILLFTGTNVIIDSSLKGKRFCCVELSTFADLEQSSILFVEPAFLSDRGRRTRNCLCKSASRLYFMVSDVSSQYSQSLVITKTLEVKGWNGANINEIHWQQHLVHVFVY